MYLMSQSSVLLSHLSVWEYKDSHSHLFYPWYHRAWYITNWFNLSRDLNNAIVPFVHISVPTGPAWSINIRWTVAFISVLLNIPYRGVKRVRQMFGRLHLMLDFILYVYVCSLFCVCLYVKLVLQCSALTPALCQEGTPPPSGWGVGRIRAVFMFGDSQSGWCQECCTLTFSWVIDYWLPIKHWDCVSVSISTERTIIKFNS